jgi:hypothetical protein
MRVLAIDVGIKNLAFCYVDNQELQSSSKILWWENVEVTQHIKPPLETLIEDLLMVLQDRFAGDEKFTTADIVLIENQPSLKNGTMKTIAVAIFTFFVMLKAQHGTVNAVRFMSPTAKLKCKLTPTLADSKSYKARKSAAIETTRMYIDELHSVWFDKQKKKDDLADAFLMTQRYVETSSSS